MEKRAEIGWKVVRRESGERFYSPLAVKPLEYSFEEYVRPKPEDGPLCVFSQEKDAEKFAAHLRRERPDWDIAIFPCFFFRSNKKSVWTNLLGLRNEEKELPPGTVLAEQVMLTNEAYLYFTRKLEERRLMVLFQRWPRFESKEEVDKWFQELDTAIGIKP